MPQSVTLRGRPFSVDGHSGIPSLQYLGYGGTSGNGGGGTIHFDFARGSEGDPVAVNHLDFLGGIGGRAWNGAEYPSSSAAAIHFIAHNDQSATNSGQLLRFWATVPNTTTRTHVLDLRGTNAFFFKPILAGDIVATNTLTLTGDSVTLARDVKSRDAASVGEYGAAFGDSTTAGYAGAAFGAGTTAGNFGAAFGYGTSAGDYGFAAGAGTSAGYAGFAAGSGASAGDYGFAAGEDTSADFAGFAAGAGTSAGDYGFAAGAGTLAYEYGAAFGESTTAGEFGFSAGRDAHGTTGSFVFADSAPVAFNRTNSPNSFSVRAAGGAHFLIGTNWLAATNDAQTNLVLTVAGSPVLTEETDPTAVLADGTRPMTGSLDMGGNEVTGIGGASLSGAISYAANATNLYIRPDGGTNTIYFDAASNMVIAVDGSPALTISPAGNVGLNVNEPEAQLDVGGDVLVRSNLFVRSNVIQIGEEGYGSDGRIRVYNGAEGRFDEFGQVGESSFAWGAEDGPKYGFSMDGEFGGDVGTPWYGITYGDGVVFRDSFETNTASITVSVNPPGFIFNVNGVIWTNTP
jgi:hypothetical protein